MKLIVCIKQVPAVAEIRFDNEKKTIIREGVHNEINPFDRRALTFAASCREKYGGEVLVITMGPPQAKDALMEALGMGGDRALHLLDRAFAGSDTLATARALSMAIVREKPFDMVVCGKYSVDAETGHIGPELAQLLHIPHATGATKIEFSDSDHRAFVETETDYGFQKLEIPMPALVTTAERLVKPRRASPEEIETARTKPYSIVTAADLSSDSTVFGSAGSPTSVSEIYSIEPNRKNLIIGGSNSQEKVSRLVETLISNGLFTGWKNGGKEGIKPPDSRDLNGRSEFWVTAEKAQGRWRPVTYELLGRGLELAGESSSELCAITFAETTDAQKQALIEHGADKLYIIEHDALSTYSSDAYADALSQAIRKFHPSAVVAAATSLGRDFMPRVAADLGLGMTSDCIGLELNSEGRLVQLKPAFGGNVVAPILSRTTPQLATIRPGMLTPSQANPARKGSVVEFHPVNIKPHSRVIEERYEADQDALKLDNAEVVVSAGAGVGGPDNLKTIRDLAEALDAPLATTRKVVDLGWLPRQLQIGLTGRSVSPKLYVAVAVRGAFNHMVGVGRARTIVAINNDPNAPIFKNCDYGLVGDFAEVVPVLTASLREAKRKTSTQGLRR
jgi:electron transfer flavoprotein alpha subunit